MMRFAEVGTRIKNAVLRRKSEDAQLVDTANIVDVPADLSTPFDHLTNSDTDAGQQ